MSSFWKDIRFGLRTLAKTPGTTLAALIALALGIGANSAIFSVVSGVLLKPLPYPEPDRLMSLINKNPQAGLPRFPLSIPDFEDFRRQTRTFEGLAAYMTGRFNLTGGDRPEAIQGAAVTAGFFHILRREPVLGQAFRPEDERPGGGKVVVLSEGLWRRRFGADRGIVGRGVILDGESYTVLGVAPSGLDYPEKRELWVPLTLDGKPSRGAHYLSVVGRLKPGATLKQARAEMTEIAGRLERQYPDSNTGWGTVVIPLAELEVEDIRTALLILLVFVGFVLLIAVADVANLLLARVASRDREIALRTVLGAGRGRLVRQMLTETLILFLAGGAVGLLLAAWGVRALVALDPEGIPRSGEIHLDSRVLLFTLAVSLGAGLLCGLVPALTVAGRRLGEALKEGGRAVAGSIRGRLVRDGLVLAQIALTLALLLGAGLLIRSFARLRSVDPGFRPQGVLTAGMDLPPAKYPDKQRQIAFYQALLERVRALPGVEQAGVFFPLPLSGDDMILIFAVEGRPAPPPNQEPATSVRSVTPGALEALGIPLRRGRLLTDRDDASAPPVLLVNEAMAAQIWPHQDPIGQRVTFGSAKNPQARWYTVVGVVGNVRHEALSQAPGPEAYWPHLQTPLPGPYLVLRGKGDPARFVAPVRAAVAEVDPDLPLNKVAPMTQLVAASLAQSRFKAVLLALFAGLALVLAVVGVYGVVSYSVAQRAHEIGIRMALGARPVDVLRSVLAEGAKLTAAGTAVGLAGALVLTRYLRTLLYQLSPNDPVVLAGAAALLGLVSLAAVWMPARRATKVHPIQALRNE
ncbi:MAG TPA: ABC transporter permease [Thermoanaerobaculia bacterium]